MQMRMKRIGLSLMLLAGAAQAAPKLIKTGWDTGSLLPEDVMAKASAFDDLPWDGMSFSLGEKGKNEHTGYLRVSCGHLWSREHLKRFIPIFSEAKNHKSMRTSFLNTYFMPTKRLRWQDDAAWKTFAENMATLAWIARASGLKGLLLDTEDYWRSELMNLRAEDGLTYDEAAALARRRGAEVFGKAFAEYPDMHILTYWWLSRNYGFIGVEDPAAFARGQGDLMVPFTDGMLDVMPPTVRFFDGNEHTYHWLFNRACVDTHVSSIDVIAPENRAKYRQCMSFAPAFYLDMYTNPQGSSWYRGPTGGSRLNTLLDRYEDAMLYATDYIWMFGERHACIDWGETAKRASSQEPYTNGTWNAALPGFYEQLAILRHPCAELLPRLKKLKQAGQAVNLADAVKKEGNCYNAEAHGAQYGEWYAVLVEAKGGGISAGLGLKRGANRIWDRPTARVAFDEMNKSGVRRGLGFQRVWGGADTVYVDIAPVPSRAELQDVKVYIYKVFVP